MFRKKLDNKLFSSNYPIVLDKIIQAEKVNMKYLEGKIRPVNDISRRGDNDLKKKDLRDWNKNSRSKTSFLSN